MRNLRMEFSNLFTFPHFLSNQTLREKKKIKKKKSKAHSEITETRAIQFENRELDGLLRKLPIERSLPRKAIDNEQWRETQSSRS